MDVTRLRIVSYDRQAYLNTQAKAYSKTVNREYEISLQQIYSERPVSSKTVAERHKTYERVIILIHKLKRKRIDITRNYNEWFDIGCALASEYALRDCRYSKPLAVYIRTTIRTNAQSNIGNAWNTIIKRFK